MKISTKGRYALRLMLDLALHDNGGYIPIKEIAKRQEISDKYLEQIISILGRAGYVQSVRGAGGGYRLAHPLKSYTVGMILRLTEGNLAPVTCLECDAKPCNRKDTCPTLPMWTEFHKMVNSYFDGITLEYLISNKKSQ